VRTTCTHKAMENSRERPKAGSMGGSRGLQESPDRPLRGVPSPYAIEGGRISR
jgi:hypothetical protein